MRDAIQAGRRRYHPVVLETGQSISVKDLLLRITNRAVAALSAVLLVGVGGAVAHADNAVGVPGDEVVILDNVPELRCTDVARDEEGTKTASATVERLGGATSTQVRT